MSDLAFNTIKKKPKGALEILPHPTLVGIKWRVSYCMTPYDQVANDLPLGPFFWPAMYNIVSVVSFFHYLQRSYPSEYKRNRTNAFIAIFFIASLSALHLPAGRLQSFHPSHPISRTNCSAFHLKVAARLPYLNRSAGKIGV